METDNRQHLNGCHGDYYNTIFFKHLAEGKLLKVRFYLKLYYICIYIFFSMKVVAGGIQLYSHLKQSNDKRTIEKEMFGSTN